MDFDAVRRAINIGTEAGEIMANVVISVYRSGKMINLYTLDHLDKKNFSLAVQVMSYRREPGWSDDDFYQLELYAKRRLGLEVPADPNE